MHASRSGSGDKLERNLKSDESSLEAARCRACASHISKPKTDNLRLDCGTRQVRFKISAFGFEVQDSSDFKFSICFLTVALLFIFSISAFAHHGAAAEYDLLHPITLKGVVTEFRYVNPHSQIYFDVTDGNGNGNVVNWAGELNSPYSLTQDGWTKKRSMEALKPGTPISVIIAPGKSGKPVGLAQKIFNAKGEQLLSETNTGLEPDRRPPALK